MRQDRRGGGLISALLALCSRPIGYSEIRSENILYGLEVLRLYSTPNRISVSSLVFVGCHPPAGMGLSAWF